MSKKIEAAAPVKNENHGALSLIKRGVFSDNPVLIRSLGLVPLLGATASLKGGLLISAVTFLVLVCSAALCSLLYTRTPAPLRPAFPALSGALFFTPLYALSLHFFPYVTASLGIFLPLCAVSGILFWQAEAERFDAKHGLVPSIAHAAGNGLGFALAALILSLVREALGAGTLLGRELPGISGFAVHFVLLPPGAFLAAAVLLAAVQRRRLRGAGSSVEPAAAEAGSSLDNGAKSEQREETP